MPKIQVQLSALSETRPYEYAIRFVFGGAITAAVGVVAKQYGPVMAGLFLAFPSILPAAITLLAKHEQEKHEHAGHRIALEHAKDAAAGEATGTALGSIGLIAFGAIIWQVSGKLPSWTVLILATLAWFAVGVILWWLESRHEPSAEPPVSEPAKGVS
jgi:hypothetical protein